VTGVDDIVFGSYVTPSLTTLAQPTDRMAAEALRLLALRGGADEGGPGSRVSFAPTLVRRQSTR
jgi:LacI family transcriptional regulator